jgi:hypothetical protein
LPTSPACTQFDRYRRKADMKANDDSGVSVSLQPVGTTPTRLALPPGALP